MMSTIRRLMCGDWRRLGEGPRADEAATVMKGAAWRVERTARKINALVERNAAELIWQSRPGAQEAERDGD